jgi:hypothetical protein
LKLLDANPTLVHWVVVRNPARLVSLSAAEGVAVDLGTVHEQYTGLGLVQHRSSSGDVVLVVAVDSGSIGHSSVRHLSVRRVPCLLSSSSSREMSWLSISTARTRRIS